jgi:hypothetical protein
VTYHSASVGMNARQHLRVLVKRRRKKKDHGRQTWTTLTNELSGKQ